jgi:hypothetical protein
MLVMVDVLSAPDQDEPYMVPTVIAGRKWLAINTGHFVFFGVGRIVNNPVNPRTFAFLSRFELVTRRRIGH